MRAATRWGRETRRAALVLLGLTACLDPSAAPCADGVLCGGTQVCAPVAGCAEPSQIEACLDLAEGDACSTRLIDDGECRAQVCQPTGCGNGRLEGAEVCDDGNRLDGDGCAASCLSDEMCGNGLVDRPVGEDCDDAFPTCRADCTTMRCGDGITDPLLGESCDDGEANSAAPDAACRINCQPPSCGDSVVDPGQGETCDDGNHLAGDGCRPDCRSSGACGNGIVDGAEGEQCDDGNLRGGDGCAATCGDETLRWRDDGRATPPARSHPTIGYDQARARVVLFGGLGSGDTLLADTWEWDGTGWHVVATPRTPSPRHSSRMAYDSRRGRMILFGGASAVGNEGDTWLYDGATWTPLVTPTMPPGRVGHGLVYDSHRGRVVMFGGVAGAALDDTWELGTDDWLAQTPAVAPPARYFAGMAYDPVRGRTVLQGGFPGGQPLADTWTWDGAAWTELTGSSPGSLGAHNLTFDAAAGHIFFYDGAYTWNLVGDTWLQRVVTTPYAGPYAAMTYDVARRQAVVFGGQDFPAPIVFDRTYTWDDVAWDEPAPMVEPSPRALPAMAYDARRGVIVLFGGYDLSQTFGDTWEYDGAAWQQRAVAGPAARAYHTMTYDAARGVMVLFGGSDGGSAPRNDTWEYDGEVWAPQATVHVPPARMLHAMAYDAAGARTVLFGGDSWDLGLLDDTWAYDGTDWSEVGGAGPPARLSHAMAYDPETAHVVMYGGNVSSTQDTELVDDTWVLDGATWTQVAMNAGPPPRGLHALAYDAALGGVIVFGGSGPIGENLADAWHLRGTEWLPLGPTAQPSGRSGPALAYLPRTSRLVMFGGNSPTPSTWSLGYDALVTGEACSGPVDYDDDGLASCADDDCWSACAPLCPPTTPVAECPATPSCGDGTCGDVEDCRSCPDDCQVGAFCGIICGDGWCDAPETAATCPGDCPA